MFDNDYKSAMDEIKPDGYIKQKVMSKLDKEKGKKKSPKIIVFRTAAAIAACVCVALSVWIIKPENRPPVSGNSTSYKDIYTAVKQFKVKNDAVSLWNNFVGGFMNKAESDGAYEYYADDEMETGVLTEGATDINGAPTTATGGASAPTSDDSYSETTTQVEGVSESDIVKTDGKYIYSLSGVDGVLRIIKAGKEPELMSKTQILKRGYRPNGQMYLVGDKVVIIVNVSGEKSETAAVIYDVSNPKEPKIAHECIQSGAFNDSRVIGDKLYLITQYYINMHNVKESDTASYIPSVNCGNYNGAVAAESVYINKNCMQPAYTVVCAFSIKNGKLLGSQSLLGGTYTLYCSTENIITAGYSNDDTTPIARFSLNDGNIKFEAEGSIKGTLLNQFSIDEYKGNFRFVTTGTKSVVINGEASTNYKVVDSNSLYVLNNELKQIGAIEDVAPDERVYSVRFMGDTAYFVTFRQVDPLFSVDLSNPKKPKIIGALKIPGFSNYLFPYGEGKLLGLGMEADEETGRTSGVKLSMFDISDPANVTEGSKTVLDSDYSDALYNHKAALVDAKRNLIAFATYGRNGIDYMVYSYRDGEIVLNAQIELGNIYDEVRGLYINQEFYVVTEKNVSVYSLENFEHITTLDIK